MPRLCAFNVNTSRSSTRTASRSSLSYSISANIFVSIFTIFFIPCSYDWRYLTSLNSDITERWTKHPHAITSLRLSSCATSFSSMAYLILTRTSLHRCCDLNWALNYWLILGLAEILRVVDTSTPQHLNSQTAKLNTEARFNNSRCFPSLPLHSWIILLNDSANITIPSTNHLLARNLAMSGT